MDALMDYGALGVFCAYLIYQERVVLQNLLKHMDANTCSINEMTRQVASCPKKILTTTAT